MKTDSNLTSRGDLQPEPDQSSEILRRIANAISGVRFGSVEVVIQDAVVDDVIKTIIETARTGEIGDGRVFLLPIEQGYNIRTGERDVV